MVSFPHRGVARTGLLSLVSLCAKVGECPLLRPLIEGDRTLRADDVTSTAPACGEAARGHGAAFCSRGEARTLGPHPWPAPLARVHAPSKTGRERPGAPPYSGLVSCGNLTPS